MENIKLMFYGTEKTGTDGNTIECYVNNVDEISIVLIEHDGSPTRISLDKRTAIRFVKELRKQISNID
jgi:hypothetical protein